MVQLIERSETAHRNSSAERGPESNRNLSDEAGNVDRRLSQGIDMMMNRTQLRKATFYLFVLTMLGSLILVGAPVRAQTLTQDDPDRIDKIAMINGQSFVGEIISETDDTVTMLVTISGISAEKTFNKSEIFDIRRDAVDRPTRGMTGGSMVNTAKSGLLNEANRIPDRPDPNDPRPVVFKIPLKGLIGWDVTKPNVERLWKEAVDVGADYVAFEFDCHEGHFDLEELRDMFEDIKTEARENEIDLVAWVKEARGTAVAYVLMFEDVVFYPDGWMGDAKQLDDLLKDNWKDPNVRAKMIAAWVGICRGMAIDGGHSSSLCEALIRPELHLWVKMKGEKPTFKTYLTDEDKSDPTIEVVDSSETESVKLEAKDARKFGVTKHGSARDMRTLMQQLDVREYIYYEGDSEKSIDNFMALRKRGVDDVNDLLQDIAMILEMPLDERGQIGQQITKWKKIVRILKACPPHMKAPYGFNAITGDAYGIMPLEQAEAAIQQLQQQMRAINKADRQGRQQRRSTGGSGGRNGGGG